MILTILIITGVIILLVIFAYLYWIYVPSVVEPELSAKIKRKSIPSGNYEQTYLSYDPPLYKKRTGRALIIVLHGAGINGKTIREWTGFEFDLQADRDGTIVLYPDGYKTNWNESRLRSSYPAKKKNIDDVAFIKSLIYLHVTAHGVDPSKVFIIGYSNGGEMAYRFAIDEPYLLNSIATISSCLPTSDNTSSKIDILRTRIMMVHGTKDFIVPYHGGKIFLFGQDLGTVISSVKTAETFASAFGAEKDENTIRLPHLDSKDPTGVDLQKWRVNGEVVLQHFTVHRGGHVVPQQKNKMPRLMGRITGDLDAPKEALLFFGLI